MLIAATLREQRQVTGFPPVTCFFYPGVKKTMLLTCHDAREHR
jgi:hypothetical protein